MKKVLMLVTQDPMRDPRIYWEATSLNRSYNVKVVGFNEGKDKSSEWITRGKYSYQIKRIKLGKVNLHLFHYYIAIYRYAKNTILLSLVTLMFPFSVFVFTGSLLRNLVRLAYRFLMRLRSRVKISGRIYLINRLKNVLNAIGKRAVSFVKKSNVIEGAFIVNYTLHYLSYVTLLFMREMEKLDYRPDIIHCNDLDTLLIGVILKKRYNAKLIYDCHELWPESIPNSPGFLKYYLKKYEESFIGLADHVFIVSSQLKTLLEEWYGLKNVDTLPNAEIYRGFPIPSHGSNGGKVAFLFQGGYAKERGLENLIRFWSELDPVNAVLYLRGKENEFSKTLREMAGDLVSRGKIVFLDSVTEDELVRASMKFDVGIIPYEPVNLNHKFCCPNKFSQYLHAGLAVLSNNLPYLKGHIVSNSLGLCYDSLDKQSFLEAAARFIGDKEFLAACKNNSRSYGKDQFNWQKQGRKFLEVYDSLE